MACATRRPHRAPAVQYTSVITACISETSAIATWHLFFGADGICHGHLIVSLLRADSSTVFHLGSSMQRSSRAYRGERGSHGMLLPHPAWSDDRGKVAGAVVGKVGVTHSRINSPRRAEGLRNSLPLQDVSTVARTDCNGRGRRCRTGAAGTAAAAACRGQSGAWTLAQATRCNAGGSCAHRRSVHEGRPNAREIRHYSGRGAGRSSLQLDASAMLNRHHAAAKTDATPP